MATKPAPTCCSRLQYILTTLFYLAGIVLSGYAYYVEYQLENEPGITSVFYNQGTPCQKLTCLRIFYPLLLFRIRIQSNVRY